MATAFEKAFGAEQSARTPQANTLSLSAGKPEGSVAAVFKAQRFEQTLNQFEEIYDSEVILNKWDVRREDLWKLKKTDDELFQLIRTRKLAAVSVPWSLDRDDDNTEFVICQLQPIIRKVLSHAWSAIEFGYTVQELTLKQDGTESVIDFVDDVPLEWFKIDRRGRLFLDKNGEKKLLNTEFKFILTRNNPTYKNPYGDSQLACSYWAHWFRFNGWRFYMQYLERFSDPLLLGKSHDYNQWMKDMVTAGYTHVVGTDVDGDIKAVTQPASDNFEQFERIITGRLQKIWNGQSVTTQVGATGARAQAVQSNEITEQIDMAAVEMIIPAAQQVVNALWIANGFPDLPPRFSMKNKAGVQIDRSRMDLNLTQQGVVFSIEYYKRHYDINDDELEIVEPDNNADNSDQEGNNPTNLRRNLKLSKRTDAQDTVDNAVDDLIPKLNKLVDGEEIVNIILSATNEDQLLLDLSVFARDMNTDEAQKLTHDALALAEAVGYVSIASGVAVD
jgi:hypothetical protein